MTVKTLPEKLSPGIVSLLPLFYVGWSDSVLSPSEMELIHEKIRELKFLKPREKEILVGWTDPWHPPAKEVFRNWLIEMKRLSHHLSHKERLSLVEIGIRMARIVSDDEETWRSEETIRALSEIQEALGLTEKGSLRMFLSAMDSDTASIESDLGVSSKDIQKVLDRTYTDTRQRMRRLLIDPAFKIRHFRDKEVYRKQILDWTLMMAEQGLGAYAYPEKYGGRNSPGRHITVFEMLGYHDLSLAVKFGVQFGLFGSAIYNLGTMKHHEAYLSRLAKGEILGCFAMTETNHGSNVKDLETTLTLDPSGKTIIVNTPHSKAGKEYIGNALHSTHSVVFGQLIVNGTSRGIHAVVVRIRDDRHQLEKGVQVEDNGYKMGLNGIDNGKLWFDHVEVPVGDLLDKYGQIKSGEYSSPIENDSRRFFTMLGALVAGRVSVAWAGVSAAKKALCIATRYALTRRQFHSLPGAKETLLLDYPSHQRRLIPLIAKAYALDSAMKRLTEEYVDSVDKDDRREMESMAAGLKAISSWNAIRTIQECREACGGKGYLVENQFADLKADTDIFATFEGDNTVLLQLVAKGLLSRMQKEFHDERFISVFRYLATNISTRLTDMNPYNVRRTDAGHLLDDDFYLDAFTYRERKLLNTVAQRMRNYISRGMPSSEAYLRCQNHLIELARAHVDRIILKESYKTWQGIEEGALREAFHTLHRLFALSSLEENKGWYLENDYMHPQKTKAIRRMVDKLCRQLRDEAELLVDGFGIPEELITAPIAKD